MPVTRKTEGKLKQQEKKKSQKPPVVTPAHLVPGEGKNPLKAAQVNKKAARIKKAEEVDPSLVPHAIPQEWLDNPPTEEKVLKQKKKDLLKYPAPPGMDVFSDSVQLVVVPPEGREGEFQPYWKNLHLGPEEVDKLLNNPDESTLPLPDQKLGDVRMAQLPGGSGDVGTCVMHLEPGAHMIEESHLKEEGLAHIIEGENIRFLCSMPACNVDNCKAGDFVKIPATGQQRAYFEFKNESTTKRCRFQMTLIGGVEEEESESEEHSE